MSSLQFDILCLLFLLKNSMKKLNYFDLGYVEKGKTLGILDSDMINCTIMKAAYPNITSVIKIHQSSLCQYLQESYVNIFYPSGAIHVYPHSMFTELFKLPQLSILHVHINI